MEGRAENKSLTQKWNERKVKAKRNKSKHGTTTKIPLNMPRMSTDKEKKEESNEYKKTETEKKRQHTKTRLSYGRKAEDSPLATFPSPNPSTPYPLSPQQQKNIKKIPSRNSKKIKATWANQAWKMFYISSSTSGFEVLPVERPGHVTARKGEKVEVNFWKKMFPL